MKYEIVNLEEKIVIGLCCETSNSDSEMGRKIGGLWQDFYGKELNLAVKNRVNAYSIGLYSDYNDDGYTVTVGVQVSNNENKDLCEKLIPAGRYAKFSIKGNMVTAVQEAWNEIWKIQLNRSFTGDFEEYLNADFDNAEVNIYIALKD